MPVSSTSRKRIPLDVRVAYPGVLGGWQMVPPPGKVFLVDDNGVFLTDDNGVFLVGEVA